MQLWRKLPGGLEYNIYGGGQWIVSGKIGGCKIVVGEFLMLDTIVYLSTDLKLAFYKT